MQAGELGAEIPPAQGVAQLMEVRLHAEHAIGTCLLRAKRGEELTHARDAPLALERLHLVVVEVLRGHAGELGSRKYVAQQGAARTGYRTHHVGSVRRRRALEFMTELVV